MFRWLNFLKCTLRIMSDGKVTKIYDKIIFWGLFFIITLLPFLFTTKTFDLVIIKAVFFKLGITFISLVWLLKLADSETIKIPRNPVLIPFVLFIFFVLISTLFSRYKYTGIQILSAYSGYLLLFLIVITTLRERSKLSLICRTTLIAAVVICVFSLYKSVSYLKLSFWKFPVYFQFFGNPNFFASYLLLMISLSFSFFSYSHFKYEKMFLLFSSILLSFTLLLSYCQGAWVVLYFYFVIFYVAILVNYWYKMELLKGFIFALFPFLITGVLYLLIIVYQESVEKYLFPGTVSFAVRQHIWKSTLEMIKVFPFRGWGAGTFDIYFPLHRTAESLRLIASPIIFHAHNEFLEIGQEMGLLGLGVFLWLVIAFLALGLKLWIKAPFHWKKYPLAFFLGGVGILMDNLVSPSLRQPGIAVFFWFIVALTVSVKYMILEEEGKTDGLFIIFRNRMFRILKPLRKGLLYSLAIIIFFFTSQQIIKPYLAELFLKEGVVCLDEENLPQAIVKFDWSRKINPYYPSAYYKLAYAYRMIGEYQDALSVYQDLQKIAPDYARIHYNLGCLYQDLGRYKEAIGEFKTSLKRENEFIPHFRLMEVYRQLGEKELESEELGEIQTLRRRGYN